MIPDMEVIVSPQFVTSAEAFFLATEWDEAGPMRKPLTVQRAKEIQDASTHCHIAFCSLSLSVEACELQILANLLL